LVFAGSHADDHSGGIYTLYNTQVIPVVQNTVPLPATMQV
jgi:hypothetical protein